MKNSTIELLHLGKKRRVDKQEYLKLRAYNKIKTSRSRQEDTARMDSTSRTYEHCELTAQKLLDVIECLKKDSHWLTEENKKLSKQLKKDLKVEKAIYKKFPAMAIAAQSIEVGDQNQPEPEKSLYQYEYQSMLELKLSLDVIELQSLLQEKMEQLKKLELNKRKSYEQDVVEQLFREKSKYLNLLYQSCQVQAKIQDLWQQRNSMDKCIQAGVAKQKNNRRIKANCQKNLELLRYEVKNLESSAKERKKRLRKDSCEYIEIENGEVRNQQDITKEVNQIQETIRQQSQQLEEFLQQKMLLKIDLINQIEKLQAECHRLAANQDTGKSIRESIQVI